MLRDEDKWPAMHAYRKAVAKGDAPAILCPECRGELLPIVGANGDPDLRCASCRVVYDIGLHVWKQIEANISELADRFKEEN